MAGTFGRCEGVARDELSKAALKNKKKRARRHAKAVESSDEVTEAPPLGSGAEVTEPALGPGSGFVSKTTSPFDLLKKQIEEAKATGDHKRAQALREQLWKIEDTSVLGVAGENAPETDTVLLQQLASQSTQPQSKMASSSECLEDKRLRALQKKLRQIEELKERKSKGERLEASQMEKIAKESEIRLEIAEMNPL